MRLSRAQGCLVGQVAGDSLGSLVEFQSAASIALRYPEGVRLLSHGGTWDTIPGQPTDDSELALALARSLSLVQQYDPAVVAQSYAEWFESRPFDIGDTTRMALSAASAASQSGADVAAASARNANPASQANGALMRISPLGIFGVRLALPDLVRFARADAALTHPHPACQDSNVVYTAISFAIRTGAARDHIYQYALETIASVGFDPSVSRCVRQAESRRPADYEHKQGWVLTALQNAFYQLLHAPNLEEGVVDTVRCGGDTDTNAAIAGALLGAAWGLEAVPSQWLECILNCRPQQGSKSVSQPRPQKYWPVDVLTLAEKLVDDPSVST